MVRNFVKTWILPPGIASLVGHLLRPQSEPEGIQLTPAEKALLAHNKTLKDRHAGERCFILGAGSSIKKQNLKRLRGEIVISVSNAFVHHDFPMFRPKYHVLPPLLQSHGRLYPQDELIGWLKEMEQQTFDAEMVFHIGDQDMIRSHGLFKNRKIHWVDYFEWDEVRRPEIDLSKVLKIWSVSELAITVAVYMGFDKIYLLGFDHDWFNGPYAYFYDEKYEHKLKPDSSRAVFADAEFQMRRHAYIFRKYKYLYGLKRNIYNANANPDHYLDVFPKVDYESLFHG